MELCTSPAVRLLPPSEVTGPSWSADHILDHRRYRLSTAAAAVLVAGFRPRPAEQLRDVLAGIPGLSCAATDEWWDAAVTALRRRGLLHTGEEVAADPRLAWLTRLRRAWAARGWVEAAEYHLLTFDYPCLDYSVAAAWRADRRNMRAFNAEEADTDRAKLDYGHLPETPLPEPAPDLLKTTARQLWGERVPAGLLDVGSLSTIIALAFGLTGTIDPPPPIAPFLLRTSPSGGGRHPSEGYVAVRDVPGLEPGWYHVTMAPSFGLRRLPLAPLDDAESARLFPLTFRRAPFSVGAMVVVTSRFERNMYRYREPRTFRTVHMDAGHIAATIRMTACALGVECTVALGDPPAPIEASLGLDGLTEGHVVALALARTGDPEESPSQPARRGND